MVVVMGQDGWVATLFGIVCVDGQTTSPPAAVATADSMGPLNPLKGNHK